LDTEPTERKASDVLSEMQKLRLNLTEISIENKLSDKGFISGSGQNMYVSKYSFSNLT
jgi:hypothetical protein